MLINTAPAGDTRFAPSTARGVGVGGGTSEGLGTNMDRTGNTGKGQRGNSTTDASGTAPVLGLRGTATCIVQSVDGSLGDLDAIRNRIDSRYMSRIRRCAQGDIGLRPSTTQMSFTLTANGRITQLSVSGDDATISACIAASADTWRFVSANNESEVGTRIGLTLETKP